MAKRHTTVITASGDLGCGKSYILSLLEIVLQAKGHKVTRSDRKLAANEEEIIVELDFKQPSNLGKAVTL